MSRVILDTTAYSELLRGQTEVAGVVRTAEEILLPQVVDAELRYGFQLGTRRSENEKLLSRFVANSKVRLLLSDNATTDYFVAIALYARQRGVQLSSHDLWIAALAEQWQAILVTFDQDFAHLNYDGFRLWRPGVVT